MSAVDKTASALKYLPITVTPEYFLGLPENVINSMYGWLLGETFDYRGNRTMEQKAYYLYACFTTADTGTGQTKESDTSFYMYNQLKFYIMNHDE